MRRVLLAAATVLVCAPPAEAATFGIRGESQCERGGCTTAPIATFVAQPGERNGVTVRVVGAEVVTSDDGAPVSAGAGCRALDARAVACPATVARVDVDSGDGADAVDAAAGRLPVVVRLGAGDDRFTGTASAYGDDGADELHAAERPVAFDGGAGDDLLVGGAAGDSLIGGPGADTLLGGSGDDVLNVGDVVFDAAGHWVRDAPAADRAAGGPGRDSLSYFARRAGTRVDLASGQAGVAGELDRVAGVEDVLGGDGDDRIRGDDGPNHLDGYFGSDLVDGRDGDDRVEAGSGVDDDSTLIGGPGDDVLSALGAARLLDGGPGDDTLRTPLFTATERCGEGDDALIWDGGPIVARVDGCERIEAAALVVRPSVRPRDGRVAFGVFCRTVKPARLCRTTVTLANRGRGSTRTARRRIPPGMAQTLALHVARTPRRTADDGLIRVTITVRRTGQRRVRIRLELTRPSVSTAASPRAGPATPAPRAPRRNSRAEDRVGVAPSRSQRKPGSARRCSSNPSTAS